MLARFSIVFREGKVKLVEIRLVREEGLGVKCDDYSVRESEIGKPTVKKMRRKDEEQSFLQRWIVKGV